MEPPQGRPPGPPANPSYYGNQPPVNKPTYPVNPPPSYTTNPPPSVVPTSSTDVSMNLVQTQLKQQTGIVVTQVGQLLRDQKLGVNEQLQITELLQKLATVQNMPISQDTLQAQIALLQLVAGLIQSVPSNTLQPPLPPTLPVTGSPPHLESTTTPPQTSTNPNVTNNQFVPNKPVDRPPLPPLPRDPFAPEVLRRYKNRTLGLF